MITKKDRLSSKELNSISERVDQIELLIETSNIDYTEELEELIMLVERSKLYYELVEYNKRNKTKKYKQITLKAV